MEIQNCPHCRITVMPMADGACPSCRGSIVVVGPPPIVSSPLDFARESLPVIDTRQKPSSSLNPYEAPRYAGYEGTSPSQQRHWFGIPWILFSFKGRIPRRTFWVAMVAINLTLFGGFAISELTFGHDTDAAQIAFLISCIPVFWCSFAVQAKRWHDRDKSGWWILVNLIPYVGGLWALIENGFLRGTRGPNQYGPDPT